MFALKELSDELLVENTNKLVGKERRLVVELLNHLNEMEERKLFLKLGYSSMFDYVTRALRFSEPSAARRIRAARCIKEHPKLADLLGEGKLTLCTLAMSSSVLKKENKDELLSKLTGKSKREVERMLAGRRPAKKVKDSIKAIGNITVKKESLSFLSNQSTVTGDSDQESYNPETPELKHKVQFEAGDEFLEKLEQVQSLLSGKFPRGASLEETFMECMEMLLEKKCPKRREARRHARAEKQKEKSSLRGRRRHNTKCCTSAPNMANEGMRALDSTTTVSMVEGVMALKEVRNIRAKVRDRVFVRDRGSCSYVAPDGTRCNSKHDLEIDHIIPFAAGGKNEPENLQLLCRAHNKLLAEEYFGIEYIQERSTYN